MFRIFKEKTYRPYNTKFIDLKNKWTYRFETLEYFDKHITFYNIGVFNLRKDIKRVIGYSDIKSMDYVQESISEIKDKSFIGRSLLGGALLGGTGAIIGGLSSLKPTYDNKLYSFIVITLESGEVIKLHDCFHANIDFKFFTRLLYKYNDFKEQRAKATKDILEILG